MPTHVLTVRLHLDSPLALAWSDLLPSRLRIEVSESDPGFLDVQQSYHHDFPRQVEEIATDRWRLTYEARQGRTLRIAFRQERASRKPPFQEICSAFETINIFAARSKPQEAYHFGLALGAKVILEDLWRRESVLRPALTPPFIITLI